MTTSCVSVANICPNCLQNCKLFIIVQYLFRCFYFTALFHAQGQFRYRQEHYDRISDVILPLYGSSVDHGDANGNVQTGVCSGGSSGRVKGRGDQET